MSGGTYPAPDRNQVSFWALIFGASAAPVFWLGQMILGYGVSAFVCYSGDHPTMMASTTTLRVALIVFDAVAIIAALAGGVVAYGCWRRVRNEKEGGASHAIDIGDGRARFMALWGMMSSLWFLGAIVFGTIASVAVPLCVQ